MRPCSCNYMLQGSVPKSTSTAESTPLETGQQLMGFLLHSALVPGQDECRLFSTPGSSAAVHCKWYSPSISADWPSIPAFCLLLILQC